MDDTLNGPAPAVDAAASTVTWLAIPAMCCAAEFGRVDRELRRIDGVRDVTADYLRRSVRVRHAAVVDAVLLAAAARTGFDVRLAGPAAPSPEPAPTGRTTRPIRIPIATVGTAAGGSPNDGSPAGRRATDGSTTVGSPPGRSPSAEPPGVDASADGSTDPRPAAAAPSRRPWAALAIGGVLAVAAELGALATSDRSWPAVVPALAAIALAGWPTYRYGLRALLRLDLGIHALMSVAVTGAAILGQWPEAAMVMVLFALAERIEARSLDRARRAVDGLLAMAPETASVRRSDGWHEVAASEVPVGGIVRVRPGERIALDGAVVEGASAVDQAAITGESLPVDKRAGEAVFAGTVNGHGELQVRVTAAADRSTLARIVHAVRDAQASRAPTQRFVDAFARIYTPVVFAAAAAVASLPPLLTGAAWSDWVYRALVLLVVACPCALVLATPISVVSGLTAAARRGILVKGGLPLERGHRLGAIALDKTGTLTQGRPVVVETILLDGRAGAEPGTVRDETGDGDGGPAPDAVDGGLPALDAAAALASRSDHPLSMALARHLADRSVPATVRTFAALPGLGTEGTIAGRRYRLGNRRMAEEAGASSPALVERLDALERQGRTTVLLLRERTPLAIFALADTLRPESLEAVADLKRLGIEPVMLTGDNRPVAEAIAREVGIGEVRAGLLPADKLEAVARLADGGPSGRRLVGMVGDGINDAPALARADIGFAMGAAGSDTAIETADVALMDDDPRKLATFVRLSRATWVVLRQNIALALGLKVVFLMLAATGTATLWMAVFADLGGSLLVVANGLRLLRVRA